MKDLHIFVEGDVNDADYISETTDISHLSKEQVKKLYEKLNDYNPREGYDEDDESDFDEEIGEFYDYLPSMDNQELHTITEVTLKIIKDVKLKDLK